jgi:predicted DNA-binding transcriptional regulator AlpA
MRTEAMLRTPQAAEYLGVSPATLCKWRVFGGGPRYKKLGRAVVYDPAELRDWLDARSQVSTSTEHNSVATNRRESRMPGLNRDETVSA